MYILDHVMHWSHRLYKGDKWAAPAVTCKCKKCKFPLFIWRVPYAVWARMCGAWSNPNRRRVSQITNRLILVCTPSFVLPFIYWHHRDSVKWKNKPAHHPIKKYCWSQESQFVKNCEEPDKDAGIRATTIMASKDCYRSLFCLSYWLQLRR